MARVFSLVINAKNYATAFDIVVDILGDSDKFNSINAEEDVLCWFNCYGTRAQEQRLRDMLATL